MHIYILPQCSTTAASVLNSAGMDAQFERSCCAISRGILINALEVHELLFSSFQSVATNDPFVVNKDGILLFLCAQIPAVSINFLLRSLKKIDDFVAVVHIGGCCFHRVNQSAVRIHADVLLVAEVPLVALFDGMSFRITLLFLR